MKHFLLSFLATLVVFPALSNYKLVKDVNTLADGDRVLVVNTENGKVLSTTQNNNNRGAVNVTITNEEIAEVGDGQIITLVANTSTKGQFAFQVGDGSYLYASSSSANQLRTTSTVTYASVEIAGDTGNATVKFQGSYTRNVLQYNSSSTIFACYASASQKAVQLYKEEGGGTSDLIETSLAFDQDSYTLTLGQDINLNEIFSPNFKATPEDAAFGPISFVSSNEAVAVGIDEGFNTGFKIVGAGQTTIKVVFNGDETYRACSAQCTLTVIDPDAIKTFERVKSADDIQLGRQYVIVSSNWSSLSPVPLTKNGQIPEVAGAITSVDGSSAPADAPIKVDVTKVAVFTLEEGATNYALRYPSGEYLTVAGANTSSFNSDNDAKANVANVEITHGTKYDTFNFTQNKKIIYYDKNLFKSYANSNSSNVYLYYLAVPKEEVTLSWDKSEYTYDMDFGWDGAAPVLSVSPETVAVEDVNIRYASSNEDVATISNAAASKGVITGKAVGDTEISAEVDPADSKYSSSAAAKYTLHIVGVDTPEFMNGEGEAFTENSIELSPADLAAGHVIKIKKAGADYGVKVTISPTAAGKVEYTDEGATVTVTSACTVTAVTTKGDKTSSRRSTFEVLEKELAVAEISWTSARYVYDFATSRWNNVPQLTNTKNYPVVYSISNPDVAEVNAAGQVTPKAQGTTTISATVEGTDTYGANTVTATIRVTDSNAPEGYDIYELVKKGDELRENEQFIIVTGEPFNPEANVGDYTKEDGLYYALAPYQVIDTKVRDYYEAVPVEFPEEDAANGERLMVNDDNRVLRLSKQYDTSAANPEYPFLFQVMNEDIDLNEDGEILDTDSPTVGTGNNERLSKRYLQVKGTKFSFVDLPENIEERGNMNANIRVLDPNVVEGYTEEDYSNIKKTGDTNFTSEKITFTDKGEILFNGTDGKQYTIRFNPTGKVAHFNIYEYDSSFDSSTRSKANTFPVRIYRLNRQVEKPSITVFPEEPVSSDAAYGEGQTYANKVRVVIEQHPKTSEKAELLYHWQAPDRHPALPDYQSLTDNRITVFVDGNEVVDENDQHIRYIDETRSLFIASAFNNVYSESSSAVFNFKTGAPRLSDPVKNLDGEIQVRVMRPANYTKDALYYYLISDNDSKPAVTFNEDGTIGEATGVAIEAWNGNEEDTESGVITLPEGKTLWVGSFKPGYTPSIVAYNALTAFPECRPMQLLRLTDKGREKLLEDFDKALIFDKNYDASKPLYINYRNDLVNEDGSIADSDNHYHYMIQRNHDYASSNNRRVWIEQISEQQFKKIFGDSYINVDDEHAGYFEWTSDFYVFALNEDDFNSNFENPEEVLFDSPKIVTPERTYTALENRFMRRPTNADGSYVDGAPAQEVKYYGAMMENQGKLGAKSITTKLQYYVGNDLEEFNTEAVAEVAPKIPSVYGFTYEYQYEQEETPSLKAENPDSEFVKLSIPSAVEGKDNSEALIPIDELNPRHLNLVFKFHRPNISKHILENYDIYYNIKFNRLDMTDPENPVRTLLAGSGVYMDTETAEGNDDAIYRFRIDDVNPTATIYPEIEISKVTYVGNSGNSAYGQYASNFGEENTVSPAPNNAERTEMNIKDLLIVKDSEKVIDGKKYADWKYIGHTEFDYTPDIIVNNPHTDNSISLSSSFFHIESYVPGTDYYQSYEYLVKHDESSHLDPAPGHPYFSDAEYGDMDYDALRHTIIARNVPADRDGNLVAPNVVISPVYFFAYGAEMKPMTLTVDDKVIEGFEGVGGTATIVKVNDLPDAVSPTQAGADKAPRRVEASEKVAPSHNDYPMPHAGDTDMTHASVLDLSNDANYTVVYGGSYESTAVEPTFVLEWGDHKDYYAAGEEAVISISATALNDDYKNVDPKDYIDVIVDKDFVECKLGNGNKATLKFLKPTESTVITACIKSNLEGFAAAEVSFNVGIYQQPGDFVVEGANVVDLWNDESWNPEDTSYDNAKFNVEADCNSIVKFSCADAAKLKAEFYVNGYFTDAPSQTLIIDNNSFSELMYPGLADGYVIITPIAQGYDETENTLVDEYEYTGKRFQAQIKLFDVEKLYTTTAVINLTSADAVGSEETAYTHYSDLNELLTSEISKNTAGGSMTLSDAGLALGANDSYSMEIKFRDQQSAKDEEFAITAIRLMSSSEVEMSEQLDDYTLTGNTWNKTSEETSLMYQTGWTGYTDDVNFTLNVEDNVTVPQIEVTFSHPMVEVPEWELDKNYEGTTDVRGWLRHSKDDHVIYYSYELSTVDPAGPARVAEEKSVTHSDVLASNLTSDNKTLIYLPKQATLHTFAQHPSGPRSEVVSISNDIITGVESIITDGDADEKMYNLQGLEVKNPGEGVYIRVKNGRSEKVMK